MARGEFDYSTNTGALQVPSPNPDLSITPGRVSVGGVVKDGTLQALDTVGKVGGIATKQYKQYQKTRQAMNFQADVVSGTIGARADSDDTFYQALSLGNEMEKSHKEFMAEVRTNPAYADMTPEEFNQEYQTRFSTLWGAVTAEGATAEELKMTSNVAIAGQREAVAWHALEHGKAKHQENVGIVHESMLNLFEQSDDVATIKKGITALAGGGDISEHEGNALLVDMAMRFATDGDERGLLVAKEIGLEKDPRYADNIQKAQKMYTKVASAKLDAERVDDIYFVLDAVDQGVYTLGMGKHIREKWPALYDDKQVASWLVQSEGNRVAAEKASRNLTKLQEKALRQQIITGMLQRGENMAGIPAGEQSKAVDTYFEAYTTMLTDQGITGDAALIPQLNQVLAIGRMPSGMKEQYQEGLTSLTLNADGTPNPMVVRTLEMYKYLEAQGVGDKASTWIGSATDQGTIEYLARQTAHDASPQALATAIKRRQEILADPLTLAKLSPGEITQKVQAAINVKGNKLEGLWHQALVKVGVRDPRTYDSVKMNHMVSDMVVDEIQNRKTSSVDEAVKSVMGRLDKSASIFHGQFLKGSSGQIISALNGDNMYGDTPKSPEALVEEYLKLPEIQEALTTSLRAKAKTEGIDFTGTAYWRNIKPQIHENTQSITFSIEADDGAILSSYMIPMSEVGAAVRLPRKAKYDETVKANQIERAQKNSDDLLTLSERLVQDPKALSWYGIKFSDLGSLSKEDLYHKMDLMDQMDALRETLPKPLITFGTPTPTHKRMKEMLRVRGEYFHKDLGDFIDQYYTTKHEDLTEEQTALVLTKLKGY